MFSRVATQATFPSRQCSSSCTRQQRAHPPFSPALHRFPFRTFIGFTEINELKLKVTALTLPRRTCLSESGSFGIWKELHRRQQKNEKPRTDFFLSLFDEEKREKVVLIASLREATNEILLVAFLAKPLNTKRPEISSIFLEISRTKLTDQTIRSNDLISCRFDLQILMYFVNINSSIDNFISITGT